MRGLGQLKSLQTLINRSGSRLKTLRLEASIQEKRARRVQDLLADLLNHKVVIGDLNHGLLTLYVPHAAMASKLRFEERSLIDKLQNEPLFRGIRRIQCRVKPIEKPQRTSAKTTTTSSVTAGASIKEFAETLKDDDLKRQFQRLAARVSGNHPPDQTS